MNSYLKIGAAIVAVLLIVSLILLLPSHQKIRIKWESVFGGDKNEDGWFVLPTDDKGCIITGYTESYGFGERDVWLIKVDENGNEQWNKTFGGKGWDEGKAVQPTTDNGYVIAGSTTSYGAGGSDVWLIKVDENGNEQWNKTFGGKGWDEGKAVQPTTDNGYVIAGSTTSYGAGGSDVWLIKVDENGNEQWNKTFGGNEEDDGRSLVKTVDGGYAIAGSTSSYGNGGDDMWLIKVTETGREEWNVTFGTKNEEYCNQVKQTVDGGFLLVGHLIDEEEGRWFGFVVKTSATGTLEWKKMLEQSTQTGASSGDEVSDGYIIIGYIGPYGEEQDLLATKIDYSGKIVWTNAIGGDYADAGVWIQKISGNQFFVTGYRDKDGSGYTDLWLLKIEID